MTINDFLLSKPMPTTVAEFKNHPLYVVPLSFYLFLSNRFSTCSGD